MKRIMMFCMLLGSAALAANTPPVIRHETVRVAEPGKPLTIRATVMDDAKAVLEVNVYATPSRDTAPYKFPMQDSGAGVYVGLIPGHLLVAGAPLLYYIEAVDAGEAVSETEWARIVPAVPEGAKPPPAAPDNRESHSWGTAGWIAGGAAVVGGAALALGAGGGDGGDDGDSADADSGDTSGGGGGTVTTNHAGTYLGSATTCLEWSGAAGECDTRAVTFVADDAGRISSDDLYPGQSLVGTMSGDSFTLDAVVAETNATGTIRYSGSIVSDRITGSIGGSATSPLGSNGVYYGTFYAVKQ